MKFTWRTEWPLWVLLAAMFALAAVTWPHAPDRIPIRWGMDGEVNGYGGKFAGLLLVPLVALAIYLIFLIMPRLDPYRANYAQFSGAYTLLRFAVLMVLALAYGVTHFTIRGHSPRLSLFIPIFVGALFVTIGMLMPRFRRNWFVGVRTPWTLSSERAWTQTHRVAGRVFMLIGACLIVTAALRSTAALIATLAIAAVGIVGTIAYSYFVWRDDPDRAPRGTHPAG